MQRIMLFSGGLDSFIIWRLLDCPPAIYFKIGHRAEKEELKRIEMIQKDFGGKFILEDRLRLTDIEKENGYIPLRNLFFILLASYYADEIIIAQIAEWAPDKNKKFYRKVEELVNGLYGWRFQDLERRKIRILVPFRRWTKTKLVKYYCKRFLKDDLIKYTYSCYLGEEKHCGKCNGCITRYLAFRNCGIREDYQVTPDVKNLIRKINWRDFRIGNLIIYIQRILEFF